MDVVIDRQAQKQLKRTPRNIIEKLRDWVVNVTQFGLRQVAKQPGYHDEPLSGKRKGQRSIRLSRQWRAIYSPLMSRISIQTVTPHDYRVHGAAEVPALPFLNQLLGEEIEAMNQSQKREIAAALIKAGRRDLAEQLAAVRQTVVANPTRPLKTSRMMLAEALKQYGKNEKQYILALASAIDELSKVVYDVDRKSADRLMDAMRELSIIGSRAPN